MRRLLIGNVAAAAFVMLVASMDVRASVLPASPPAESAARHLYAPPSAADFTRDFVGATNAYAQQHGDERRIEKAECVEPNAGNYMCSYGTRRPGAALECHLMQATWTPERSSTFTVTIAGRVRRCGTLREALRSLS